MSDYANDSSVSPTVRAANALTARWCAHLDGEDAVLSGAGVWPLLALLASAADEPARSELSAATGRPARDGQRDAQELLNVLRSGTSTVAAMGIWAREGLALRDDWTSHLPEGMVRQLTHQAVLDQWTAQETDGLIDRFPIGVDANTLLVLASALAMRVCWRTPFDADLRDQSSTSEGPGQWWLRRITSDLTGAAVLDGNVTRVVVEGDGDVDIHLLIGVDPPGSVLATGLRELSDEAEVRSASEFAPGNTAPGLTVHATESEYREDELHLRLPDFEIRSRHDLLAQRDVFGLASLTDAEVSHLPLMSPSPLFVSSGTQDVVARFFDRGFEAAAVIAFDLAITGALMPPEYRIKTVNVSFEQPFGFLAVHRPSRLAVLAGWVSHPFHTDSGKNSDS